MHFSSARAYLKAFGLNLKEKSSGKLQGRLRISRFGSGRARQWLWLAVHRWRDKDPIAQAWYQRKVQRDGGRKARAAVALMRKLAMALFHVARGETLDSEKLFDIRKPASSWASSASNTAGQITANRNTSRHLDWKTM